MIRVLLSSHTSERICEHREAAPGAELNRIPRFRQGITVGLKGMFHSRIETSLVGSAKAFDSVESSANLDDSLRGVLPTAQPNRSNPRPGPHGFHLPHRGPGRDARRAHLPALAIVLGFVHD